MNKHVSADEAHNWLVELARKHRVSPTQRRVIQYMLSSLPEVAFASTVDIAEAAGVSQPTVTRLATALGYSSYPEFRNAIRTALRAAPGSLDFSPSDHPAAAKLGFEQQNIAALERTIAGESMGRAVDLLARTRPLGIVGMRGSAALADYLGYFANRILPDIRVLNDAASLHDDVLQLHLDGGTALLAFVMPRYPAATLEGLAFARSLGIATVAIVDCPVVPFIEDVDALLVAPVGTRLVFDSHAAAVVLAISLLDALAARQPERTEERLEAHEGLVERWSSVAR
jgi:DNA-binding MurR/RpiR family transcriptional regulator